MTSIWSILAPSTRDSSLRDADSEPVHPGSTVVGAPVVDGETSTVFIWRNPRGFPPIIDCRVH